MSSYLGLPYVMDMSTRQNYFLENAPIDNHLLKGSKYQVVRYSDKVILFFCLTTQLLDTYLRGSVYSFNLNILRYEVYSPPISFLYSNSSSIPLYPLKYVETGKYPIITPNPPQILHPPSPPFNI